MADNYILSQMKATIRSLWNLADTKSDLNRYSRVDLVEHVNALFSARYFNKPYSEETLIKVDLKKLNIRNLESVVDLYIALDKLAVENYYWKVTNIELPSEVFEIKRVAEFKHFLYALRMAILNGVMNKEVFEVGIYVSERSYEKDTVNRPPHNVDSWRLLKNYAKKHKEPTYDLKGLKNVLMSNDYRDVLISRVSLNGDNLEGIAEFMNKVYGCNYRSSASLVAFGSDFDETCMHVLTSKKEISRVCNVMKDELEKGEEVDVWFFALPLFYAGISKSLLSAVVKNLAFIYDNFRVSYLYHLNERGVETHTDLDYEVWLSQAIKDSWLSSKGSENPCHINDLFKALRIVFDFVLSENGNDLFFVQKCSSEYADFKYEWQSSDTVADIINHVMGHIVKNDLIMLNKWVFRGNAPSGFTWRFSYMSV